MAKLALTEKEWLLFKKYNKHPSFVAWDIQGGFVVLIYRDSVDMKNDIRLVSDTIHSFDPRYMIELC